MDDILSLFPTFHMKVTPPGLCVYAVCSSSSGLCVYAVCSSSSVRDEETQTSTTTSVTTSLPSPGLVQRSSLSPSHAAIIRDYIDCSREARDAFRVVSDFCNFLLFTNKSLISKINERIQYRILYLIFELLCTMQPPYLCDLNLSPNST